MKEIQRIKIDGRNWNDILNLPCVYAVYKTPAYEVFIKQDLATDVARADRSLKAVVGDTLVEYNNHKWEVKHDQSV